MIKAALIDLDGTILDSMGMWETLGEDVLSSLGFTTEEDLNETFKTFTVKQAAEYYYEHFPTKLTIPELERVINVAIEENYIKKLPLKKGAKKFLEDLKKRGLKLALVTTTSSYLTNKALERLEVSDYFDVILSCDDLNCSKNEPKIYHKALKDLRVNKNEAIVFEDAFHAIKTAKFNNFLTIGVFDPNISEQEAIKKLADYYIYDFERINNLLDLIQKSKDVRTALTIAGSDSSGGAGIQADLKTMITNDVYGMSAITALTAQNTTGVKSIMEVTPEFLEDQLEMIFEDIYPNAIKIGMVSSSPLIKVIGKMLRDYRADNIVVDPVMVATSGSDLMKTEAVKTLTEELFPIATLVTPNIPEAEILSGITIKNPEDMEEAAKKINQEYGCAVLLKGGHSINDANDLLVKNGEITWFNGELINNPNTHGTGCTLSSAIASNLAKGYNLESSIKLAKEYLTKALKSGLNLGRGRGPMNHAFKLTD